MGKQKLKGKDLRKLPFTSNAQKSAAINIMAQHYKHLKKPEKLDLLNSILTEPNNYKKVEELKPLVNMLLPKVVHKNFTSYQLKKEAKAFNIFGKKHIEQKAVNQMEVAMKLPVAIKGALLPDAHLGYGLPIGGVLATKNEIIPYAVGVDIGCRMALSILEMPASDFKKHEYGLKKALAENTHFGRTKGKIFDEDHEVLNRRIFDESQFLKNLKGKAIEQIGTSGSGNHFVEFGIVELPEVNQMKLPQGLYVGILSHSGSRGIGAAIANHYTQVAADVCRLPKGAIHLAWLDLQSAAGAEYWQSMNLAGDYAKACHDVIHQKLTKVVGAKALCKIENHHNFAWQEEQANGETWVVHRKGATPAQKHVLGIIPGSMTTPAFIVSGKGNHETLNSASHGAGRRYSRSKMKSTFTKSDLKKALQKANVKLLGGDIDEAPQAYKNIHEIIEAQNSLLNIEGTFTPKIVKMNKK